MRGKIAMKLNVAIMAAWTIWLALVAAAAM